MRTRRRHAEDREDQVTEDSVRLPLALPDIATLCAPRCGIEPTTSTSTFSAGSLPSKTSSGCACLHRICGTSSNRKNDDPDLPVLARAPLYREFCVSREFVPDAPMRTFAPRCGKRPAAADRSARSSSRWHAPSKRTSGIFWAQSNSADLIEFVVPPKAASLSTGPLAPLQWRTLRARIGSERTKCTPRRHDPPQLRVDTSIGPCGPVIFIERTSPGSPYQYGVSRAGFRALFIQC